MLVFLNGQIIKEEDAKISINDLSYQFGYGLFETIRCEQNIPLFFEDHYKRLTRSARELSMPLPVEINEASNWIKEVLKANNLSNARVKVVVSKKLEDKFNVLILSSKLENLPSSYKLYGWTLNRDINSVSFRHKTTSRADSYVAYKVAQENSCNDAVYLNEKNELVECTKSNIFLVLEDKIITPVLESGILSGVTRAKLIEIAKQEGIALEEKNVHKLYLNKALGVFITSAMVGVMPVSQIQFEDKQYFFERDTRTTRLKNLYDLHVNEYIKKNIDLSALKL